MSRGIVGSRGGRPTIASPLHKDVFDLESGACYTRPGELRLRTWRARDDDGVISVAPHRVLVAASHGTSDERGRAAVARLVEAIRDARPELTIVDAFVDVQQPAVPSVIETLTSRTPMTVVPLLLSAGYHVRVDLADAQRLAPHRVRISGALGPDARLAKVLARRLREAGVCDGDAIVLAAAGSSDVDAVEDCRAAGRLLAAELGRPVTVSFVSAAEPRVADAVRAARIGPGASGRVAVATYLLAPGYFSGLVDVAGADVTAAPLLSPDGEVPDELVSIVSDLYECSLVTE